MSAIHVLPYETPAVDTAANWVTVRRFSAISQWHAAKSILLRAGMQALMGDGDAWTGPGPCPPGKGVALLVPSRQLEDAASALSRAGFIV